MAPDGADIRRTGYIRENATVGVVHIGYGAFHRAHQAVYLDDCMEITGDLGWGVAAVNLREEDSASLARARKADGGYLLKTVSPDGEWRFRLVRPHLDFADWPSEPDRAEALLGRPGVHAVTVTVTEGGYCVNGDLSLDPEDPAVSSEIAGGPPLTIYAYLARSLERRASATGAPITILSCDNVRANGRMLERNFLEYLERTGRDRLARWVRRNVAFPNSMVDRITPRATSCAAMETDAFPDPVVSEEFIQWVVEDRFAGPMPELARAGVQVVGDVEPFEEAKIRILNGGHTGLAYLGILAGHDTFDAAMRDTRLRAHFDGWEREEVLPGLAIGLPFDKSAYLETVTTRLCNPAIADPLERVAMDGWSKMPIYVRPTLASCLDRGLWPRHGFDCVASWYVCARRFAAGKTRIRYHDSHWRRLGDFLAPGREPAFARTRRLWADLPERYPEFGRSVVSAIERMERTWPA